MYIPKHSCKFLGSGCKVYKICMSLDCGGEKTQVPGETLCRDRASMQSPYKKGTAGEFEPMVFFLQ